MTGRILKSLLRVIVLLLIALPVIIPFAEKLVDKQPPTTLTVWIDANIPLTEAPQKRAELILRKKLQLDPDVEFQFKKWGSALQTPLEDHEELLSQLGNASGAQVIVGTANLWGPAARQFRRIIESLAEKSANKLLVVPPEELQLMQPVAASRKFLALSELSAPQLNFLGEPTQLSLDIIGQLSPSETADFEVVIRSGEALLSSQVLSVTANEQGIVDTVQTLPLQFTRAQQQLLTAEIKSEFAVFPLSIASTPVSVVHSKTTILHVGVGPDWSLRNMRTKLKFWPNLDLLSYYILREVSDDLRIPSSQLSLIEFPSEKLFGEQLPNFHGVLAQNFAFESYLNAPDSQNLFEYVNKNGGRLVFQAGPLSFLGRDSNIAQLMPCSNQPTFDNTNEYRWRPGQSRLLAESQFEGVISNIISRQTAIGCKPKPGALVLAETADEARNPTVIAYPVGQGLVVAFLAGDWHTAAAQSEAGTATQRAHRVYALDASEQLFQWMVEFLQRRQDSGLRPPQFAGPRLYRDDLFTTVRSRGGIPTNAILSGRGAPFDGTVATPTWLPLLGVEAIRWKKPLTAGASLTTSARESSLLASVADEPSFAFQRSGLDWLTADSATSGTGGAATAPLAWPVIESTARAGEKLKNPILFPERLLQAKPEFFAAVKVLSGYKDRRAIPLIEAFPWLMALTLAIVALEQLIGRLAPARRPRA